MTLTNRLEENSKERQLSKAQRKNKNTCNIRPTLQSLWEIACYFSINLSCFSSNSYIPLRLPAVVRLTWITVCQVSFFGSSLFHIRKTFITDHLPVFLSFLVSYFRVIFLSHFRCFLISGSCCYFPKTTR